MMDQSLISLWEKNDQGHVFQFYHTLSPQEQNALITQAERIDVTLVRKIYQSIKAKESQKLPTHVEPLVNVSKLTETSSEEIKLWQSIGHEAISSGKVCALLLAGGQGTRLGTDDPKGLYDVGLLSHKTLYQLQAEKIISLQRIVAEKMGSKNVVIPWYIMTSFATEKRTKDFFDEMHYFGLQRENVIFFNQDLFPCISTDGKILLNEKSEISIAPNGNGGMWSALKSTGVLKDMERRGIQWISSYPVDNILTKICDPIFIGFCMSKNLQVGCKVVPKLYPEERVGVLAKKNGNPGVIEYSEITPDEAHARDPVTNELLYNASHIVLNNFNIEFIKEIVQSDTLAQLPYHFAKKNIPCINDAGEKSSQSGYKFELFVFDVFEYASDVRFGVLEVLRDDEFAPLKNSIEFPVDNPITCREKVSELHKKYIEAAGGKFTNRERMCEISSLLSYAGENLEGIVKGRTFELPMYFES